MLGRLYILNGWDHCQEQKPNCFSKHATIQKRAVPMAVSPVCYTPFTSPSSHLQMAEQPTRIHWRTLKLCNNFAPLPWICPLWAVLSLYTKSIYPQDFFDGLLSAFIAVSVVKRSLNTEHQHWEDTKCIHKEHVGHLLNLSIQTHRHPKSRHETLCYS